ncbi:DUF732 domain-containing protein [Mycobacterium sp. SMC-4]|uniref:DUF732 domain-containing protein n=1 Tax=Mycobacterium sp. SMC-4 TaxID=2857059 RepID=UPI0021B42D53|nr:DUF732 domain-containing protein [Mycobacterium sp. SMC-4]UXA17399.1 DUF732 domain-containing protein [Mycobacterium sp. SMC-4]
MKITFACAAATLLAGSALFSAPTALADPEGDFLSVIADYGITWPSDKTAQVIETGYAVCQDWVNGATFEQEVLELAGATGWPNADAGYFIGAATGAFCPEFEYKVG